MITVTLPWPSPKLSPNARTHWAALAKEKKLARLVAALLTASALALALEKEIFFGQVPMRWTFHPPTRNTPDRDNMIARCKAYQDGIADALGVDDKYFSPTYQPIGEVVKGGAVIVEIGNYAAQKETEADAQAETQAQETHYPLQAERVLLTGGNR